MRGNDPLRGLQNRRPRRKPVSTHAPPWSPIGDKIVSPYGDLQEFSNPIPPEFEIPSAPGHPGAWRIACTLLPISSLPRTREADYDVAPPRAWDSRHTECSNVCITSVNFYLDHVRARRRRIAFVRRRLVDGSIRRRRRSDGLARYGFHLARRIGDPLGERGRRQRSRRVRRENILGHRELAGRHGHE